MNNLGIYIHIPFCVKKCDYCDFLSAPSDEKTMRLYVDALKKEIKQYKEKMQEYLVDTVFIGGGTPSILDAEWIKEILDRLRTNCNLTEDAEITIECNPGTVTREKLEGYRDAGINRLSFGLQSTNNKELKSIGRIHTYEDFLESYHLAKKSGFSNINIDLMSALPGQTIESYEETLEKIIKLNSEHISAYSLILEEGTVLKNRVEIALKEGQNILPNEDDERQMYYLTKATLEKAGYIQYEISNYAKSGHECKHNIGYWKRKDYLGFGIGAASLYQDLRYNNIRDLNQYIKGSDDLELIQENQEILSERDKMAEFMFLGLRMTKGVSRKSFQAIFGKSFESVYGKIAIKLIKQGLLEAEGEHLRLTEKGVDISNYVMAEFI